jgi:ketosteroid isomerase-like protein
MSRRLIPLILALMLAAPTHPQAVAMAPAAEELTQLLKEFLDGASRNDVAAHDRFWADDLIYTRSSGVRMGKAEILENARSGPTATAVESTEYSAEDIRIRQYGDTAVVAFRLVGRTGSGPRPVVEHFLNTGVFVKRNGEWRVVVWQATRVPESEAPRGAKTSGTQERG